MSHLWCSLPPAWAGGWLGGSDLGFDPVSIWVTDLDLDFGRVFFHLLNFGWRRGWVRLAANFFDLYLLTWWRRRGREFLEGFHETRVDFRSAKMRRFGGGRFCGGRLRFAVALALIGEDTQEDIGLQISQLALYFGLEFFQTAYKVFHLQKSSRFQKLTDIDLGRDFSGVDKIWNFNCYFYIYPWVLLKKEQKNQNNIRNLPSRYKWPCRLVLGVLANERLFGLVL